jgi:hypothetical protein
MRMRMRSAPLARSTDGGQQGGGRRGRKKRKKKERADGAGACTVLYCTAATWPALALHAAGGVTQKQDRSNCLLAHACLVCGDYSSQLFFAYNYGVITELLTQLVALIMCLVLCH